MVGKVLPEERHALNIEYSTLNSSEKWANVFATNSQKDGQTQTLKDKS